MTKKTSGEALTIFNFYVLIHTFVIILILILKLISFFFYIKKEDKTINIITVQQINRTQLFNATIIVIVVSSLFLFLINFILINFITFFANMRFDIVMLRVTLTYLIFSLIIVVLLINFILFLYFIFNIQFATILITLIMAFGFIASLPYQFLSTSEKSKSLVFESDSNEKVILMVEDIYDAYEFQSNVNKKRILYPNLSNFINEKFLNEKMRISNFSELNNVDKRIDIWKEINIIKNDPLKIEYEGKITRTKIDSEIADWKFGTKVKFETYLKYNFLSMDELSQLINNSTDETKKILIELEEFTNYIMSHFMEFQKYFYSLFDDFIILEECENISNENFCWNNQNGQKEKHGYIEKINDQGQNDKRSFKVEYLLDLYKNYYVNLNGFTLNRDEAMSLVESDMSQGGLFNPLMLSVRILENYFIKYTSNFVIATNYSIKETSTQWRSYIKPRKSYDLMLNFNFLSNLMLNYTYFSGFSYNDFWFEPNFNSKISFEKQKNMFLPYTTFTLKIKNNKLDPYSYNYFLPVYYYLIFQILISFIFYVVSFMKFKNMDLN
ncbi:hypothetical protein [Spiroplasma endosymbiont of Cantharis rufa]|uniref:hypothetical protein n=1 Tax=Spiroplasma endosymbiont of Cantharis rufa TaxID=3066279 RepID=UPI0030CD061A